MSLFTDESADGGCGISSSGNIDESAQLRILDVALRIETMVLIAAFEDFPQSITPIAYITYYYIFLSTQMRYQIGFACM